MTPGIVTRVCSLLALVFPVQYEAYLRSPGWKEKANAAKERAGWRCQTCNRPQGSVILEAHHRTYERLGWEIPEDLTVLCSDCHDAVTMVVRTMKRGANSFSAFRPGLRRGW